MAVKHLSGMSVASRSLLWELFGHYWPQVVGGSVEAAHGARQPIDLASIAFREAVRQMRFTVRAQYGAKSSTHVYDPAAFAPRAVAMALADERGRRGARLGNFRARRKFRNRRRCSTSTSTMPERVIRSDEPREMTALM